MEEWGTGGGRRERGIEKWEISHFSIPLEGRWGGGRGERDVGGRRENIQVTGRNLLS